MEFGTLPSTCGVDAFESELDYEYMLGSTIIHVFCARSTLRYWSAAMVSSVALGVWKSRLSVWVHRWNHCTRFQKLRTALWCAIFMACYVLQWAYYATLPTSIAVSKGSLSSLHSGQGALQKGDIFMWYASTVKAAASAIQVFILLVTCFQHIVGYPLLTRWMSRVGHTTHGLEDTLMDPSSIEFDLACRYVCMFFTAFLFWLYSPRDMPLVVQILVLASIFITLRRRSSLHAYQRILTQLHDTSASVEQACGICLDDFSEGERVKRLPCGHLFHGRCVRHWLHMHNDCPMCRRRVYTPVGLPLYRESSPRREVINPLIAPRDVSPLLNEEDAIIGSEQPPSHPLPQREAFESVPAISPTAAPNSRLNTASCPVEPRPNAPAVLEDVVREIESRLSFATQRRQQVLEIYQALSCESDVPAINREYVRECEHEIDEGDDLFQDEPLQLKPLRQSPERKRARSRTDSSSCSPLDEEPREVQRRNTRDTLK
ncbi:unnamed protein product [Phytomonas sp. Hart1]|nr:unnamed protein product [Phytomonas sp. Hart1]|eukprot:CCW66880.1 unnamed protein product [Phytomonas sp. isolate Hart1]